VALSADGNSWYLLNASPDLLTQIQNFPPLAPKPDKIRDTPIQGVLLTNADLDHTLGLALLREGPPLVIHSTRRVHEALSEGLRLLPMLEKYCGVQWRECNFNETALLDRSGNSSGLTLQAFDIPGSAPKYHQSQMRTQPGDSVGYVITDLRTNGCLVFAPDVSIVEPRHLPYLERADVLLFDGTFWSEDEMEQAGTGKAKAADMGHLPISGSAGSLAALERLPAKHRVYVHLNNTNPILLEDSPQRELLTARGIVVGQDGMEFDV
jgi:pyrroloquinoline quinone biosynthesis protein B